MLSTDTQEIVLPHFPLTSETLDHINETIIKFLKQYIFINDLELIPQLINIHHSALSRNQNSLEIIYGFIIDYNRSIDPTKCYWIDFDPMKENKFSTLFFETMQKLS